LHGFAVGFPTAKAADIRDTACRSTEECRAEEAKIRGQLSRTQTSRVAEIQDYSYWIGRINMASTVMLSEQGIIPKAIAPRVAEGVAHAITEGVKPKGRRPADRGASRSRGNPDSHGSKSSRHLGHHKNSKPSYGNA
jgi:hypothetical protein